MTEGATDSAPILFQNARSPQSPLPPSLGYWLPSRSRLRAASFCQARLGRRAGSAGESLLAGRVVAAAPELPALLGALARCHLDRAAGAGRGEEVALRGELEERERLFRR